MKAKGWNLSTRCVAAGQTLRRILAHPLRKGRRGKMAGMTLLEIIIVVGLLATLMGLLVRNLLAPAENAKIDQTRIIMGQIQQSLQMFRVSHHKYPTTEQGLAALVKDPGDVKGYRGPFIEEDRLNDVWSQPFVYESNGKDFKIISGGPDKQVGTEDDVVYPEAAEPAQGKNEG